MQIGFISAEHNQCDAGPIFGLMIIQLLDALLRGVESKKRWPSRSEYSVSDFESTVLFTVET